MTYRVLMCLVLSVSCNWSGMCLQRDERSNSAPVTRASSASFVQVTTTHHIF